MRKSLMLLRHAKAEPWGPDIVDFDRPLAARGRRHMARLAAWMASRVSPPEKVLCSPSARTRETLAPLLEMWPELRERCAYPRALYGASAGTIHGLAEDALAGSDSVLLVGHNPGFEDLAFSLLPHRQAGAIHKMPTGTLAVFDFGRWPNPGASDVELRHWLTRRDLSVD